MITEINCPCCEFSGEAEDEQAAYGLLRDHVLWTHYREHRWGSAPTPLAAIGLFAHIGVLTPQEAQAAALHVTRRPSFWQGFGYIALFTGLWFLLGVWHGYTWGSSGRWESAVGGGVALCLFTLVVYLHHRLRWRRLKSSARSASEREIGEITVPDTPPA